jgi:hypothetical protein
MRIIDCQLRSLSGRAPIRPDLKGEPSMSDRKARQVRLRSSTGSVLAMDGISGT